MVLAGTGFSGDLNLKKLGRESGKMRRICKVNTEPQGLRSIVKERLNYIIFLLSNCKELELDGCTLWDILGFDPEKTSWRE